MATEIATTSVETTDSHDTVTEFHNSKLSHAAMLPDSTISPDHNALQIDTTTQEYPATVSYAFSDREDHQLNFKYENGQWKATVREKIGVFSRQEVLPVVCQGHEDIDRCLLDLQGKPTGCIRRNIHVVRTKQDKSPSKFVYLGRQGLQGGGHSVYSLSPCRTHHQRVPSTKKLVRPSPFLYSGSWGRNRARNYGLSTLLCHCESSKTWPRVYTGTDSFGKLLQESDVFVDKSTFIKAFLESPGDVVLITRPRRWGKPLDMDMLRSFLTLEVDKNGKSIPKEASQLRKLFAGGELELDCDETKELGPLKISDYPKFMKYQGKFPVISVGFKDVQGRSFEEVKEGLKWGIYALYQQHPYLKKYYDDHVDTLSLLDKAKLKCYFGNSPGEEPDLKGSLKFLSRVLSMHFKKNVYILMDEYDTPINDAYLNIKENSEEEYKQVIGLFRGLMGHTFKGNEHIKRGLITGILRIAKANLFFGLNNVQEYTLLDKTFSASYGFTQQEVDTLLERVPTLTPKKEIKNWYNSYTFGDQTIYNPWSIMSCVSNHGTLSPYWMDSGNRKMLDSVLSADQMQKGLIQLLQGEAVKSPIVTQISLDDMNNPKDVYSLLLFTGYLNAVKCKDSNTYQLSIPNLEVKEIYQEWLMKTLSSFFDERDPSDMCARLLDMLVNREIAKFKKEVEYALLQTASPHIIGPKTAELFYNAFFLGLQFNVPKDYTLHSETNAGESRIDRVLIPKPKSGKS